MRNSILVFLTLFISMTVHAKKSSYRKSQDVSFDGSDVDGVARNPDGAYLLQKKGIKFMPLYKVRKKFDEEIKNSTDYLR